MFQVRKDGFKDNPAVPEELDLVEEEDQFTHMITLDDATTGDSPPRPLHAGIRPLRIDWIRIRPNKISANLFIIR
jgi:hypothetical protein